MRTYMNLTLNCLLCMLLLTTVYLFGPSGIVASAGGGGDGKCTHKAAPYHDVNADHHFWPRAGGFPAGGGYRTLSWPWYNRVVWFVFLNNSGVEFYAGAAGFAI